MRTMVEDVITSEPGLKICLDESMDLMVMRKDVSAKRVFISPDTWDTLCTHLPAKDAFMTMARERIGGFRLLDRNTEPWATAVSLALSELEIGGAQDRLEMLRARVRNLVAESASTVRPGSDPTAVNLLMERHALAHRDLTEILNEALECKTLLDMASKRLCGL